MSERGDPGEASVRRLLVVDDHPIVRQGVRLLLESEPDLTVCAEAENTRDALRAAAASEPDVAIVDLSLPGAGGLELIRALRAEHPRILLLVLSMHEEQVYAERALRAGAHGYVSKQEAPGEMVRALRRILAGQRFLSEGAASHVLARLAGDADLESADPIRRLSDRELEVFRLIGSGLGTRQIAQALHLSVKTVESHRAGIKHKLGLRSGIELVRQAVQTAASL
ncbi:MAG TPA: response regulator transcription factor [Candidatus Binatia bacterium]|nr:response regulator transcription factor [Candidatus Binatia bacterium]